MFIYTASFPSRRLRAIIDPLSLALIAVLGVVLVVAAPSGNTPGKKHFWEFWKKNPVEQVDLAAAAVAAAKAKADADAAAAGAAVTAQREAQLKIAQDAAHAAGSAIAAAAATTAGGALPVRELATAKQLNDTNTQAMDHALGAADPGRIRDLEQMVHDLNAGVAAGSKALELMQGSLEAAVQEKAAAKAQLELVQAAGKTAVAAAESARDLAVKKESAWALERDAVARDYERLKFWGGISIGLVFLAALYGWLRAHGALNLNADLVALQEHMKSFVPADVLPNLEEEIKKDWLPVHDGTAQAVEKIKSKLRL